MRAATILLVDDDQGILDSVADLLSLNGYHVVTARDGSEALPLVEEYRPDLIVSDIMMHQMSGYDLFEAVRSKPEWVTIPFIFLSARSQSRDLVTGQRMGVDGYITKPFETEDLIEAIEMRLHRARQIASVTQVDLDRTKQQIMTVFSHELRTPLTYIIGYATLLQDHRELGPEMIDDMLAGIQRGADRLHRLVEDLTLMIRIDSGVIAAEIAEMELSCHLPSLVEEVASRYRRQCLEQNIDLEIDVRTDVTAFCLSYYLNDALDRLLDNAVKFSKRDGGAITIRIDQQDGYAVIAVQDTGMGISLSHQRHIFDRLRQINRNIHEQQGVGLGLTIAQSLVQLHGGDIQVESAPGVGSTFTIRLPSSEDMSYIPTRQGAYPRGYSGLETDN